MRFNPRQFTRPTRRKRSVPGKTIRNNAVLDAVADHLRTIPPAELLRVAKAFRIGGTT